MDDFDPVLIAERETYSRYLIGHEFKFALISNRKKVKKCPFSSAGWSMSVI